MSLCLDAYVCVYAWMILNTIGWKQKMGPFHQKGIDDNCRKTTKKGGNIIVARRCLAILSTCYTCVCVYACLCSFVRSTSYVSNNNQPTTATTSPSTLRKEDNHFRCILQQKKTHEKWIICLEVLAYTNEINNEIFRSTIDSMNKK